MQGTRLQTLFKVRRERDSAHLDVFLGLFLGMFRFMSRARDDLLQFRDEPGRGLLLLLAGLRLLPGPRPLVRDPDGRLHHLGLPGQRVARHSDRQ